MSTIRQVHDKFAELIERQKHVREAMQAELRAVQRDTQTADKELAGAVQAFLPSVDYGRLERLTQAAQQAGNERDFVRMAQGFEIRDAEINEQLRLLEQRWGKQEKLSTETASLEHEYNTQRQTALTNHQVVRGFDRTMARINEHNLTHERPINSDNRSYYEPFRFWAFLFDGTYRHGYKALRDYNRKHGDYFEDVRTLASARTAQSAAETQSQTLYTQLQEHNRALENVRALSEEFKGPQKIATTLQKTLHEMFLNDPAFRNALPSFFPAEEVTPMALAALKVENLGKVADNLETGIEHLDSMLDSLEAPMSKLKKGKRNKPSKELPNIDLEKIEKSVAAQGAVAAYRTVSAEKTRQGISSFQPSYASSASSSDSGLFSLQNMLIFYLLMTAHTDPAYTNETLGIDPQTANDLNIDTQNLAPDISGTLQGINGMEDLDPGLANTFNDISQDLGLINPGTIGQELGNLETGTGLDSGLSDLDRIGSIDVGHIDVGHIDIGSTNDWGGGGGYDGGGGMSMD